jgi:hypothetical protein
MDISRVPGTGEMPLVANEKGMGNKERDWAMVENVGLFWVDWGISERYRDMLGFPVGYILSGGLIRKLLES